MAVQNDMKLPQTLRIWLYSGECWASSTHIAESCRHSWGTSIFNHLIVKEYRINLVQFQARGLGTWRSQHLLMVHLVYSWGWRQGILPQELARRQLGHVPRVEHLIKATRSWDSLGQHPRNKMLSWPLPLTVYSTVSEMILNYCPSIYRDYDWLPWCHQSSRSVQNDPKLPHFWRLKSIVT